MKLTGYKKEAYDYTKEGNRYQGTNVLLYFSYKIPQTLGAGVASVAYSTSGKLSRAICQGQKPLVLGGDYDIIPGEYGRIDDIVPIVINSGGKEK